MSGYDEAGVWGDGSYARLVRDASLAEELFDQDELEQHAALRAKESEMAKREVCVYPKCGLSRRTRGLCHGHYQTMRSKVRLGQADEADLERRGLLLPKGTGGSKITTGHDAFLLGSDVRGEA